MSTSNCGFPDGVTHPHMGACYRAGRRELADALRALIAEPDDVQEWESTENWVRHVEVIDIARIKALLAEAGAS